MSLRFAKVVDTHPEDNSVDLVFLDNGQRCIGAQVLSLHASTRTGVADLPVPDRPQSGDKWDTAFSFSRDVLAFTASYGHQPVVLGFLFPQVNQMLFAELNRRIDRHASDVYTTVDADGNMELYHPSGTYLRIGTAAAHEDLTGKDFDKRWKIERNTDKAVHVHLRVSNAGEQKAALDLDPDGNIDLEHVGNLTTNTGGDLAATVIGNATIDVSGTTDVTSGGAATLTAPSLTVDSPTTTFTGNVLVQGSLTYQGGMAGSGGSGAAATIAGNVAVTGGEVTVDGIGVKSHHHTEHDGPPTSSAVA